MFIAADRISFFSLVSLGWWMLVGIGRKPVPIEIYFINTTLLGQWLVKLTAGWPILRFKELDYSLVEVRDSSGSSVWSSVESRDALLLCQKMTDQQWRPSRLARRFQGRFNEERLLLALQKNMAEEIFPSLAAPIHVAAWLARRQMKGVNPTVYFFLASGIWNFLLIDYARQQGVHLKPYFSLGFSFWRRDWFRKGIRAASRLLSRYFITGLKKKNDLKSPVNPVKKIAALDRPVVGISYQGKGVGEDLSKNTDLYWLPFTQLDPQNMLVYFSASDDPLDDAKNAQLRARSIQVVALDGRACTISGGPIWSGMPMGLLLKELKETAFLMAPYFFERWHDLGLNIWLARQIFYFVYKYVYWKSFFSDYNIKINVNYYAYGIDRLAADQAMENIGGISVSSQRSDMSIPSVFLARSTDVHFCFSKDQAQKEGMSGSRISHQIVAGYLLDGAFSLVRERSAALRRQLLEKGAKFVICFLDENSLDDKRRGPSHEFRAENYRFLFKKLFSDSSIGLIFKPKKPSTLRRRLGSVATMLEQALASGRCHVFEEGVVASSVFPCEAALAADFTVGILGGSTAVTECVLAGAKGLLLDREDFKNHPLSRYQGTIVFSNWNDLWVAISSYRENISANSELGDWSQLVLSFDPFRDGRAMERMGGYIGLLAQNMTRQMSKEHSINLANERYRELWGSETIISFKENFFREFKIKAAA